MTSILNDPIFKDETKAREWLEARVWPEGPTCPHCGNADKAKITALQGKAHRPGLYQCSRVPRAVHRDRQNRIRAQQDTADQMACRPVPDDREQEGHQRPSGPPHARHSYKSTWFMMHRLREAMRSHLPPTRWVAKEDRRDGHLLRRPGQEQPRDKRQKGADGKEPVLALVERGGQVHSHHVSKVDRYDVGQILNAQNRMMRSRLHDRRERSAASRSSKPRHGAVKHSVGEYVRGDGSHQHGRRLFLDLKRGIPACISTSREASCTAILRSSISVTTIAQSSA